MSLLYHKSIDNYNIVFIPAYDHNINHDIFQLEALKNQSYREYTLIFIDPHQDHDRKDILEQFARDTNIQTIYFPYERDSHPRIGDVAIMNVPYLLSEKSKIFRYQQYRIMNEDTLKLLFSSKYSCGCMRHEIIANNAIFPPDRSRSYLLDGYFTNNIINEVIHFDHKKHIFYSNIKKIFQDRTGPSFGDWAIKSDEYLALNGIDEAATAYHRIDDIELQSRWSYANSINIVDEFEIYTCLMAYFKTSQRSEAKKINKYKHEACEKCKYFIDSDEYIQMNNEYNNNINGYKFHGMIQGYDWFTCETCGMVVPRFGNSKFMDDRIRKYNKVKSSVGILGYGRNLESIRNDTLNAKDIDEMIEVINHSWENKKYFE